jgi:hypothetical protein
LYIGSRLCSTLLSDLPPPELSPSSCRTCSAHKQYRRLVGAFERIFGATIFFGTGRFSGKATMIQRSRFNFMRAPPWACLKGFEWQRSRRRAGRDGEIYTRIGMKPKEKAPANRPW